MYILGQLFNLIYPSCFIIMKEEGAKKKQGKVSKKYNRSLRLEEEEEQEHLVVRQASTDIVYPEYLDHVNFFAIQSFEAAVEDTIIHRTYHQAIMENKHLFVNKHVLHLTDGINCLYSIFAAEAGSQKVYCVLNGSSQKEMQNIYMMRQIIKQNKLQNCIEVLSYKDFNAGVDIIITEPMGYCLQFDGQLDRIIQLRDLYLVNDGIMFPDVLSFKCAIVHDQYYYDHKVQYWNNVYGIPMKSMKQWISHEPLIRIVDPSLIVSQVIKIATFNLPSATYDEVITLNKQFDMLILCDCMANGLAFWFELDFNFGSQKFEIKASPWFQSTKYTQTTLYWSDLIHFKKGNKVKVNFTGKKYPKEGYSLIRTIIEDKQYDYSFS